MSEEPTFGHWLKQRRSTLGFTQDQFAHRLGFSLALMRKLESGDRRPSGQIAALMADYFRVPADEREAFIAFARSELPHTSIERGAVDASVPWGTARSSPSNLPALLTLLIGREAELARISELLLRPRVRLLTLNGPPGIGKTRLALQAASDLAEHFGDGVHFVDLSTVTAPAEVLPTIARALGLTENRERTTIDALLEQLREKRMLVLLDNFEQVLDAALDVVRLLEGSPHLKVLVTSREALHIMGEHRFPVPPLGVPDPSLYSGQALAEDATVQQLIDYPAVNLFIERAQDAAPGFDITRENAADVAAVCAGLEGIPLAIELAAGRVRHLHPGKMLSALEARLQLLTGGARDLPPRQRTLRSAIEWSYGLLNESEQLLFNRLGIFVGGFTRQAAEAMESIEGVSVSDRLPSAAPSLTACLVSLVDKSLLKVQSLERGDGLPEAGEEMQARYAMLEVIREFAMEHLDTSTEAKAVREQHALYCLRVAEEAGSKLAGSGQKAALDRLEREHANIRAALGFLLGEGARSRQALELGMRLSSALDMFWYMRGYTSEGRHWLEALIEAQDLWLAHSDLRLQEASENEVTWIVPRASAMSALGLMTYMHGDFPEARRYYGESLSLSKQTGDRLRTARALNNLGMTATQQMDLIAARDYYEEALALAEELGQPQGVTRILNNLGVVAHKQGDYDGARRYYKQSLELRRELEDKQGQGHTLSNIGGIEILMGDLAAARACFVDALEIGREVGDEFSIARALLGLGDVALKLGDYDSSGSNYKEGLVIAQELDTKHLVYEAIEGLAQLAAFTAPAEPTRAARLLGVADSIRGAASAPRFAEEQRQIEAALASCLAVTDDAAWHMAWSEGYAMPMEEAIAYALE